jgi:hypothetical protein
MKQHTCGERARGIPWLVVLLAAAAAMSSGCTRREKDAPYSRGRIHVDRNTKKRWDAGEDSAKARGDRIKPIPADRNGSALVPFGDDAPAMLRALRASSRHGAGDKRILSALDANRRPISSGVIAEITLISGSEYKEEAHFRKGWLPIALVVVPKIRSSDAVVYPALNLHGDSSWVYVREKPDSSWVTSVARIVGEKVVQDSVYRTVALTDSLEPVIGARFAWDAADESIWAYCGGKCCRTISAQHQ